MSGEQVVDDENAKLDFPAELSDGDDLHRDAVLSAQHPRSPDPNEMLFVLFPEISTLRAAL